MKITKLLEREKKETLALEEFHMTGYLRKRNTKISNPLMRNWDKRWFALDDQHLMYAESPKKVSAKQSFPVTDILEVKVVDGEDMGKEGKGIYEFEVTLPGRTLRLRPKSDSQRRHWIVAIEKVVAANSKSRGKCTNNLETELNGLRSMYSNNYPKTKGRPESERRPQSAAKLSGQVREEKANENVRKALKPVVNRAPDIADFDNEDWSKWRDEDLIIDDDDDGIDSLASPKRKLPTNAFHSKNSPPPPTKTQRTRSNKENTPQKERDDKRSLQMEVPSKVYSNSLFDEEEDEVVVPRNAPANVVQQLCFAGVQQDENWLDDDWDDDDDTSSIDD